MYGGVGDETVPAGLSLLSAVDRTCSDGILSLDLVGTTKTEEIASVVIVRL